MLASIECRRCGTVFPRSNGSRTSEQQRVRWNLEDLSSLDHWWFASELVRTVVVLWTDPGNLESSQHDIDRMVKSIYNGCACRDETYVDVSIDLRCVVVDEDGFRSSFAWRLLWEVLKHAEHRRVRRCRDTLGSPSQILNSQRQFFLGNILAVGGLCVVSL